VKKILLIVLLLSFGFSQKLTEVVETYDNGNIKSITYHKKTRTGIEKVKDEKYYENGQKEEEGTYKGGKPDGKYTTWYENGQKKEEGTFKDGKGNGLMTSWYEDGQKKGEVTFKDGELDGLWTSWYENGQKKSEGTYKVWIKDGLYTEWYETGQKLIEGTYKDGERISAECWDEDGNEIECD